MDILRKTLGGILLLCWASAALAQGNDALQAGVRNIERSPGPDGSVKAVRQSGKALEMADIISEPELFVAAMLLSANPEVWLKAMERAGKAGALKNFAQLADPGTLADRFYESVDPRVQRAILSRTFDSARTQRWMDAFGDPRFFRPAIAVINPAADAAPWVKVGADGRMIRPVAVLPDPGSAVDWARIEAPQYGGKAKPWAVHRTAVRRY